MLVVVEEHTHTAGMVQSVAQVVAVKVVVNGVTVMPLRAGQMVLVG
jgi:hypothetical protein